MILHCFLHSGQVLCCCIHCLIASVVNTWPQVVTLALSAVMSSNVMLHCCFCFTASAMIIGGM